MHDALNTAAQTTRELLALIANRSSRQCLLLVDPVLRPFDADDEGWQQDANRTHTPVPILHPGVDPLHYPTLTLLRLDADADRDLIAHSVEQACAELDPRELRNGNGRRVSGWIVTDASADEVAWHLGRIMLQRHPSGHTVWLRLQDPAVLWVLSGWLQPAQLTALLGPIRGFHLLTPAASLLSLQPVVPADDKGLDLNAGQWAAIDLIGPLNTALRDWGGINPEQLRPARSNAFAAIRRAKAMEFNDPIDLALYGRYALAVHPRFDFHPLVISRLRARKYGDHFGALISDLGPQDWARIAREAPPAPAA